MVHATIELSTDRREQLVDITDRVKALVERSGLRDGLVNVYAQGATAAIMIQENWDASVPTDVVTLLAKLVPRGVWQHDAQDGNGDAHLKAGLVGPSESIPVIAGSDSRPGRASSSASSTGRDPIGGSSARCSASALEPLWAVGGLAWPAAGMRRLRRRHADQEAP
jgi:secondary thiamine-phosphate synthase enzyme